MRGTGKFKGRQLQVLQETSAKEALKWIGRNVKEIETMGNKDISITWWSDAYENDCYTRRRGNSDDEAFSKALKAAMREWKEQGNK